MIKTLEAWDKSLIVLINSWHNSFFDELMWIVSGKILWVVCIFFLLYFYAKKTNWKKAGIVLGGILICVLLADQISVHLFKNVFQRYRPSHNLELTNILHYHQYENGEFYKGGEFGFVSSHASNFFAIATLLFLSLRKTFKRLFIPIFFCATLIGYSRIYLGVHYPSDVICGGLLGMFIGYLVFKFSETIDKKFSIT